LTLSGRRVLYDLPWRSGVSIDHGRYGREIELCAMITGYLSRPLSRRSCAADAAAVFVIICSGVKPDQRKGRTCLLSRIRQRPCGKQSGACSTKTTTAGASPGRATSDRGMTSRRQCRASGGSGRTNRKPQQNVRLPERGNAATDTARCPVNRSQIVCCGLCSQVPGMAWAILRGWPASTGAQGPRSIKYCFGAVGLKKRTTQRSAARSALGRSWPAPSQNRNTSIG